MLSKIFLSTESEYDHHFNHTKSLPLLLNATDDFSPKYSIEEK